MGVGRWGSQDSALAEGLLANDGVWQSGIVIAL